MEMSKKLEELLPDIVWATKEAAGVEGALDVLRCGKSIPGVVLPDIFIAMEKRRLNDKMVYVIGTLFLLAKVDTGKELLELERYSGSMNTLLVACYKYARSVVEQMQEV